MIGSRATRGDRTHTRRKGDPPSYMLVLDPVVAKPGPVESSFHQPPLDRPAAQLVAARQLELAQHGADMGLDRLRRDVEALGDLLVEVAARDQAEDLPFAWGELIERCGPPSAATGA